MVWDSTTQYIGILLMYDNTQIIYWDIGSHIKNGDLSNMEIAVQWKYHGYHGIYLGKFDHDLTVLPTPGNHGLFEVREIVSFTQIGE